VPTTLINGALDALTFETLTVDATVGGVGFTTTKLRSLITGTTATMNAVEALLTVETNPMRFTLDGTAPTTTVGHLLNPGDSLVVSGIGNLKRFKAIRTGAASATVAVTYYA
jgi:hypothetical protein